MAGTFSFLLHCVQAQFGNLGEGMGQYVTFQINDLVCEMEWYQFYTMGINNHWTVFPTHRWASIW